jgi:RimJ/RimL family protein N-acetyltransferase
LREIAAADGELLDAWRRDPLVGGEFNDFGPSKAPTYAERLAAGSIVGDDGGALIVEVDGSPVGSVSWHRVGYGPNVESGAWNVGISLLPEARGLGTGWRAQRLLAEWLLSRTDANRVEASTDVANVAEQRSLEKAGYVREGVVRGAQHRAKGWHDLVCYSLLRADLDAPPPAGRPQR